MAGKRHIALANLAKAGIPGPGRRKMTDEERAKGKHILQHMKEYIASGEAAEDFEKLRLKMTDKALDMAMNRTIGPVRQEVEHSGAIGISITREIVRKGQD